jgi:hypothetical protein
MGASPMVPLYLVVTISNHTIYSVIYCDLA